MVPMEEIRVTIISISLDRQKGGVDILPQDIPSSQSSAPPSAYLA